MQIKIMQPDVERISRVWEGVERISYNQWAVLQQGGFVMSFIVSHQNEKDALPVGEYVLDPSSFSSKNGRLTVDRVKLAPGRAAPVSKAS